VPQLQVRIDWLGSLFVHGWMMIVRTRTIVSTLIVYDDTWARLFVSLSVSFLCLFSMWIYRIFFYYLFIYFSLVFVCYLVVIIFFVWW
jgi:hypothetical protein